MIRIYDANAFLRQVLMGNDFGKFGPRQIYEQEMNASDLHLWVWDGGRHNERRQAIFPGYKVRDYTGQENVFATLDLYRELLTFSPSIQISVPEWEADDVIATLVERYATTGEQLVVHTNDFDYQQLLVFPNVKLVGVTVNEDVPHHLVPVYKALVGDKSDKIPGLDGFGPKSWLAFLPIAETVDRLLAARDIAALRALPWPKGKARNSAASDENLNLICDYYQITKSWPVPSDLIDQHVYPGVPCRPAAEQLLGRFFL